MATNSLVNSAVFVYTENHAEDRLGRPKRLTNLKRHGLDLASLESAFEFFDQATIVLVKKGRLMAIGEFRGTVISVVFQALGTEAISLISMRRASRKERNL